MITAQTALTATERPVFLDDRHGSNSAGGYTPPSCTPVVTAHIIHNLGRVPHHQELASWTSAMALA
jgi:hypothetical protein